MANYEEKSKNEWPKRFNNSNAYKKERPISLVYPVIDNDLARDNIENDLTSADMQDLENQTKF
ncbi:MAG: hypothetical protein IKK43_01920 [Clostridia bacterium]|nr:hypothetical protein [Clostridia bacterium]